MARTPKTNTEDTQAVTDTETEALPTVEEAQAMFAARPDLHAVLTDQGRLTKYGEIL